MKQLLIAILLLACACSRPEPAARTEPAKVQPPANESRRAFAPPTVDEEVQNLLSLARGAVVIGRTAETTYENSAVHAIDGTPLSYWTSPMGGPEQTITLQLPARTKLTQVGVSTVEGSAPERLRFESSADGRVWTPLAVMNVAVGPSQQKQAVTATARFLRVATLAPAGKQFVALPSLIAEGQELEEPAPASIAGCWSLDGVPARFEEHGARVTGVILDPMRPIQLDGGNTGRVHLLMWLQSPMWGHAALTISRDGRHLSGVRWHENVIWDHVGDGWMGTRSDCADAVFQQPEIAEELLRRAGRYAIYGLRFDERDRLVPAVSEAALAHLVALLARKPAARYRLVAREFHESTTAANEQITRRRIDSLREALRARGVDLARLDFRSAGNDSAERSTLTEVEKLMVGTVELEKQ